MQKYHIQPIHPGIDEVPDGLARNENHLIVRVGDNWFSYTRKGDAIQLHGFSKNPKTLSDCSSIFIDWLFSEYKWCKMLLLAVSRKSLAKLAIKKGFNVVVDKDGATLLSRYR